VEIFFVINVNLLNLKCKIIIYLFQFRFIEILSYSKIWYRKWCTSLWIMLWKINNWVNNPHCNRMYLAMQLLRVTQCFLLISKTNQSQLQTVEILKQ
jgi:hypothetical protein